MSFKRNMNILVVDDERHIVEYLLCLINENFDDDIEVYRAYSGSKATEAPYWN